jgi:hypothetical protein
MIDDLTLITQAATANTIAAARCEEVVSLGRALLAKMFKGETVGDAIKDGRLNAEDVAAFIGAQTTAKNASKAARKLNRAVKALFVQS